MGIKHPKFSERVSGLINDDRLENYRKGGYIFCSSTMKLLQNNKYFHVGKENVSYKHIFVLWMLYWLNVWKYTVKFERPYLEKLYLSLM